jgi:hypothetical protein
VRLLLLNVAARSFEQLRTVGAVVYDTFAEAARERGLIDDRAGEYARAMTDAIDILATPAQLRRLFVALVSNGAFASGGTGATVLLDAPLRSAGEGATQVRHAMQQDYFTANLAALTGADAARASAQNKVDSRIAADAALIRELHRLFEARGFVEFVKKLGVPPLPISNSVEVGIEEQRVLRTERERWPKRLAAERAVDKSKLTDEQRAVFDSVCQRVTAQAAAVDVNVFVLCASAGCGKTFVANLLMEELRAADRIVIVVATSGIAATMLHGGTTVHRRFGMPIEDRSLGSAGQVGATLDGVDVADTQPLRSHLPPSHPNHALLKHADLLIWDEAFSATRSLFRSVDDFLRTARDCEAPMGGLTTLLIGDPRQIPPIIPGTLAQAAVKRESLQSWVHYSTARKFVLTRSMRQSGDATFAALLRNLGDGLIGVPVAGNDAATHRRVDLTGMRTFRARDEFLAHVFPQIRNSVDCVNRAIICASSPTSTSPPCSRPACRRTSSRSSPAPSPCSSATSRPTTASPTAPSSSSTASSRPCYSPCARAARAPAVHQPPHPAPPLQVQSPPHAHRRRPHPVPAPARLRHHLQPRAVPDARLCRLRRHRARLLARQPLRRALARAPRRQRRLSSSAPTAARCRDLAAVACERRRGAIVRPAWPGGKSAPRGRRSTV